MSDQNKDNLPEFHDMFADLLPPIPEQTDGKFLGAIQQELAAQGERVSPILFGQFDDQRFVDGLQAYANQARRPLLEYFRHSNRFSYLDRFGGMFDRSRRVEIPQGPENLMQSGQMRRHEVGNPMDLEWLRAHDVDPAYVLYFRATQPMTGGPKPEFYWTSDMVETKRGLDVELGAQAATAVVMVSTLEDINDNGGLIDDVNDDCGIAVRQVGLAPYDQRRAMFTFDRNVG